MRRLTTALIALGVSVILGAAGSMLAAPSSQAIPCSLAGSGTFGSPYLVSSASDMVCLMNVDTYWHHSPAYSFRQTADIDLTGQVQSPIGDSNGAGDFNGSYDGQGHRISGLSITGAVGKSTGLFGDTDGGGTISNLRVSGSVTGQ